MKLFLMIFLCTGCASSNYALELERLERLSKEDEVALVNLETRMRALQCPDASRQPMREEKK